VDHRPDGNDHWHDLAGARACPDRCFSEAEIASLEMFGARAVEPDCPVEDCPRLTRPPKEPCTYSAGLCERLWAEQYRSLSFRTANAYREHVGRSHHDWLSHPPPVDWPARLALFSAAVRAPRSPSRELTSRQT
jgi:hypothetical protein